jgi:hypothetical protein
MNPGGRSWILVSEYQAADLLETVSYPKVGTPEIEIDLHTETAYPFFSIPMTKSLGRC